MSFWRGETLLARIKAEQLIERFDPDHIDCAAYTLTLGSEVFVTSDLPDVGEAKQGVKTFLQPGEQIRITPGQFAFLLTAESVQVPHDSIAFISMKSKYKFRGLINVSGFHVDPGWKGNLIFGVYNAGPAPIVLTQGMPLFLIWFAQLDGTTKELYKGEGKSIDSDLISNMSGQVFSPIALNREVAQLREGLLNTKTFLKITVWAATALLIPALVYIYKQQADLERELSRYRATTSIPPAVVIHTESTTAKVNPTLSQSKEKEDRGVPVKPDKK